MKQAIEDGIELRLTNPMPTTPCDLNFWPYRFGSKAIDFTVRCALDYPCITKGRSVATGYRPK